MKRYQNYWNSGVEWIGEIPDSWIMTRLKFMAKICGGQDQKDIIDEGGIYPIFGSGGEFGKTNRYLHRGPSVLLGRKGTIDKPRFVNTPFWTVDTAFFTDILYGTNPRFFFYLCTTINFEIYKYGSAIPSMSRETLNNIPFPAPALEEQTQIAQYLDHKTSQIDKLISDKEKLIELLNEERTAIINQAVTKGLNPEVPMKDSGIEWLGEVPEHWEVGKLKLFCDLITDGSHYSPPSLEEGKRYISVKDVKEDTIDFENCKYISDEEFLTLEKNGCRPQKGDILLTKDGTIGRACLVKEDNDFVILSSLAIIRAKKISFDCSYLKEFLVSQINIEQMLSNLQGSALTRITLTIINNLFVVVPPREEQGELMLYINSEQQTIDTLMAKILQEIQLLKEYKTALISEVVTGKVDVRDEILKPEALA